MASRIAGITVEIGGDTTKLSKALEGVNKSIKTTQARLKDVNKLLKLDPSNTDAVTQKQRMYFLKNLTRHITRSFRHTLNAISSIFCHAVDKSELLGATLGFLPSSRTGAIYVWNDYQKRSPNIQIFHYLFL